MRTLVPLGQCSVHHCLPALRLDFPEMDVQFLFQSTRINVSNRATECSTRL